MTEKVMDIDVVAPYLQMVLQVKKVKVREAGRVITILPADELKTEKEFACPFLGIGADSDLTVDKFLEWKREERAAEYEKDLRS